jgi:hypothetical protein
MKGIIGGGIYERCVIKEVDARERVSRAEKSQPQEKPGSTRDDTIHPDDI